jgi:ABC-type transport system involved in multi-copper enzyme maturation permease subunit
MNAIIRYTLLTASRDWLFIGLCTMVLLAYGFALFVGNTALVEQTQMSMAYFAGSARMILVIGMIVFVCFHVRRAFENREVESILSKPISRTKFVIAYWLGFSLLAVLVTSPAIVILGLFNKPDYLGLLYWSVSMILEISIIMAFAILASLIMKSAVSSVMASFAFYLVSRLMGFFVVAIDNPTSLISTGKYTFILEGIMKTISTIIPRLDLFAKSEWLIYGTENQHDLWIFPAQSAIFIALMLSVAVFDFKRKQF